VKVEMRSDEAESWPGERVLTLQGSEESRLAAIEAVLRAVHQAEPCCLRMLVPSDKAGLLVGKQGSWLKSTRERCGIGVTVDREDKMGERLVTATGPYSQVSSVVAAILQALAAKAEAPPQ